MNNKTFLILSLRGAEPQARPVVKKVDHITISCADPAALFETLTQTLGLPVAWPLSSYPGFTTGGLRGER